MRIGHGKTKIMLWLLPMPGKWSAECAAIQCITACAGATQLLHPWQEPHMQLLHQWQEVVGCQHTHTSKI